MSSLKLDPAGFVIIWHIGSRPVVQDYVSEDPDPYEIYMDPEHWTFKYEC
jgi:hypothetical protein